MAGRVFIVSRGYTEMYEQLQRVLIGEPEVEIIYDRRNPESQKQRGKASVWSVPGGGDRRTPSHVDFDLRVRGWAVIGGRADPGRDIGLTLARPTPEQHREGAPRHRTRTRPPVIHRGGALFLDCGGRARAPEHGGVHHHRDSAAVNHSRSAMSPRTIQRRTIPQDWRGRWRETTTPSRTETCSRIFRCAATPLPFRCPEVGCSVLVWVVAFTAEMRAKPQKLLVFCWWPQRDSNPCFSLERAVSWASRRWGRPDAR
jgi:hypothetical protein